MNLSIIPKLKHSFDDNAKHRLVFCKEALDSLPRGGKNLISVLTLICFGIYYYQLKEIGSLRHIGERS